MTAVAFDPNASHQVTIVYDDGTEENNTPFKTKNKHSVYKVLRTACSTFGFGEEDLARYEHSLLIASHILMPHQGESLHP